MRQMRHRLRTQIVVVPSGVERAHARAARLPAAAATSARRRPTISSRAAASGSRWRLDVERRDRRRIGAATLVARDRMAWNEPRQPARQRRRAPRHDVLLRAARVGDDRVRARRCAAIAVEQRPDIARRESRRGTMIGGRRARPSMSSSSEHAKRSMTPRASRRDRDSRCARPTPTTCDTAPAALQRQRARCADQADADDDELVDLRALRRLAGARSPAPASAARKRVFSAGSADGDAQPFAAARSSQPAAR